MITVFSLLDFLDGYIKYKAVYLLCAHNVFKFELFTKNYCIFGIILIYNVAIDVVFIFQTDTFLFCTVEV